MPTMEIISRNPRGAVSGLKELRDALGWRPWGAGRIVKAWARRRGYVSYQYRRALPPRIPGRHLYNLTDEGRAFLAQVEAERS